MSFSGDVKEELVKVLPGETHCRLAELSALIKLYGRVERKDETKILLSTDNSYALRKCFTLLNKTFNIRTDIFKDAAEKTKSFVELKNSNTNADLKELLEKIGFDNPLPLLDRECCKRAYLRGAFLACGFVNDPSKGYHFELLTTEEEFTKLLTYLISQFNIKPKRSLRKKKTVTYIKEAEEISDVLSVLGAHRSMMEMANARIVRNVRNDINRRNNCDTANIAKAVNAASKQIEDILLISNTVGLDALPDTLKEMAIVRMENPDSSLTELGTFLNPQVGKSGVNHRMRKISEFADDLRGNEREKK